MMAAHKSNVSSFLDLRKDVCMKKILKYTGLSISIIMLTVSVVFIDLLINVRVVPVKYCIIAAVVLVILTAVTAKVVCSRNYYEDNCHYYDCCAYYGKHLP